MQRLNLIRCIAEVDLLVILPVLSLTSPITLIDLISQHNVLKFDMAACN